MEGYILNIMVTLYHARRARPKSNKLTIAFEYDKIYISFALRSFYKGDNPSTDVLYNQNLTLIEAH